MIIQTERLTLNHLAATDAPGIRPLFVDPQVMAHWDYEAIDAPALIAQLIENQLSDMAANQAFYWSLRRKGDTSVMGCFDIAEIDWQHRRAKVDFVLAKPLWGNGSAQEAMNAIIDHMTGLGLKRLAGRLHAGNMRSEARLRRLHFQQEGLLL